MRNIKRRLFPLEWNINNKRINSKIIIKEEVNNKDMEITEKFTYNSVILDRIRAATNNSNNIYKQDILE